ncbi:hypothetical protein [Glaciibacter superstes]|uniref:hypothetical protein n=1 Tax=Glaciibacter superstes TaxID=501023 RepID=UPI0012FC7D2F|nr:hypothetical protein [Glaciibacter superstes]
MSGIRRSTIYAYPWDVADASAADTIAAIGADSVTIAAAYHAVRAVAPRHSTRRVIDSDRSRLFSPWRGDVWRGQPLHPGRGADVTGVEDSFGAARDLLAERGVKVRAWIVMSHVDGLDAPLGLFRQNALGEISRHALCPSQPAVRAYGNRLIREVVETTGTDDVVLESVGPMGLHHAAMHDKVRMPLLSETMGAALSFCFCAGCCDCLRRHKIDAERFRTQLRRSILTGDEEQLTIQLEEPVVREHVRSVSATASVDAVGAAFESGARTITLHATAEDTSGGPAVGIGPRLLPAIARAAGTASLRFVTSGWDGAAAGARRLRALRAAAPDQEIGAYVTVLDASALGSSAEDLATGWGVLADAGAQELHVYHAGLAPPSVLRPLGRALHHIRSPSGSTTSTRK